MLNSRCVMRPPIYQQTHGLRTVRHPRSRIPRPSASQDGHHQVGDHDIRECFGSDHDSIASFLALKPDVVLLGFRMGNESAETDRTIQEGSTAKVIFVTYAEAENTAGDNKVSNFPAGNAAGGGISKPHSSDGAATTSKPKWGLTIRSARAKTS